MIKILITGDFCPHGRIQKLILSRKYNLVFNDFLRVLQGNTVNITNLECPLSVRVSPIKKVGPTLQAKRECIEALNYGKFSLVTLSNNHILDQGVTGLISTLEICKRNKIDYLGAGRDYEEASKVLIKEYGKWKIAFLNFSEHEFSTATEKTAGSNPLNPVLNFYDIQRASEKADYVIVILHGGNEGYSLPNPEMVNICRFFIDSGADIVTCHHTHCFSGYENYNKGLIFYGLGNFIFDWEGCSGSEWNYGYAVKFFIRDTGIDFDIYPYQQCGIHPGVRLLKDEEKVDFERKLYELNKIISDSTLLEDHWMQFVETRKRFYLINLELFRSRIYKALRFRRLIPGFLSRKKKRELLNMIKCESHREVLIKVLESY